MAGVAGWGTRKTLEEMQARAREMYGPFRDETRVDPITGLSYQFSDIRPGQDRTDPVWLTPEQNEATRAYFADGGRIGDDGIIQKDVTKPAFTQNADGSYSSGSTTQTVTAPNVGTAWGYTGKPGIFTKAWGAMTGDDFPDQVRAKTPWTQAYVNTIDPFLPWSPDAPSEGARIPPAISSLVTEPARLAEKGIKGQEFSPADNAILGMTLFAAGGIGKGLASGNQSGILGRAGSKLGLEDPLLNTPETSVPSLMQNYRDAASPAFSAGDEKAALFQRVHPNFEDIGVDHYYNNPRSDEVIARSPEAEGDMWQAWNQAGRTSQGQTLHAAGDERSAFALGGLANDQRPFYGRDVGPKGRIGDVEAETARLGLRSGLPEDPTGAGFFNPATAALLQEGVQPKQTVAYYQKQMGARGGKLPPGQWEEITQGLRPDQTVERDWLVKEIDARAPAFEVQRYLEDYDGSPGQTGEPEYKGYATKGPFENYNETVLGYPNKPPSSIQLPPSATKPSVPGIYTDPHFDHPNLEGWYRTQDAFSLRGPSSRLIEEVQPQRYQRMRDVGESTSQNQIESWARERDAAAAKIKAMSSDILKGATDAERASVLAVDPGNLYKSLANYARRTGNGAAAEEILALNDRRNHLGGLIISGKKGVARSPFTHDINASTDLLLKHLTGKAAQDDISRIAWTPGETQAARYNQAMERIKGIRYEPSNGTLYVKQDGQPHWTSLKSGVQKEDLADYVGADVAKKLLATEAKPHMPGANYSGHMLEFPQGMTLGGEGMKGFYGSGPRGEGGILTSRVKALWKKLTGQEPEVKSATVMTEKGRRRVGSKEYEGTPYPSVDLTPEMRETIRRVGLSLYSSGDEKAAAFLMQLDKDGQLGAFWGDEIGKRGADAPSKYEKRQLDENGLYSVLDESLPKINRKQANAQAWLNELKKLGVKDQEIYWRGLDDFLKSKGANGQFSKDEIAEYLGNNKVKVWDERHVKDGVTADLLREVELENLRERFDYDFEPEDYGYKIEKYAPSDKEIAKHVARTFKIVETKQNDLFADDTQAPEGSWAVLDDDGSVRDYADSKEGAEALARDYAKEDLIKQAEDDGENWVLYDKDGDEHSRHGDTDEATEKARELAADDEYDRISNMSDAEIWSEFGDDRERGTMAGHYMRGAKPPGGDNYNEAVLGLNPATLERKGSKGWTDGTGLSRDSAHPDSPYNHALGWRLQEEYRDLMNPKQTGLLAHELQSRWHARGTERGWRQGGADDAKRIAELEKAVTDAEEAHRARDHDYWVNWSAPDGTQIVKWDLGKMQQDGRIPYLIEQRARDLTRRLRDDERNIKDFEETEKEHSARVADPRLNEGERENSSYYLKNTQARLERLRYDLKNYSQAWEAEVAPYIERVIADETANPDDGAGGAERSPEWRAYRAWADQQDALSLAASEARSRLRGAAEGAHPGPFVSGDKSDIMGLLLKTGLYQAAQEGHDFFGVQGAKRMLERWGNSGPHEDYGRIDPKTGREAGVIPMTLQKLARMHRKDAKVEPLYPGNRAASKGAFEESFLDRANADGQPPLPFGFGAMPVSRGGHNLTTPSKIDAVELARDDLGNPAYVLKIKRPGYDTPMYLGDDGNGWPLTTRIYPSGKEILRPQTLRFNTREAAEEAMRQINTSKAENFRQINEPEALKAAFEEKDPVGEPFNAVRIDDDLRESILNRGFPMFAAGDERAALMAGAFQQESSNPTVRAAQKRAADIPFADRLAVQHNMRGRSFEHNVNSYGGNIPVPSLALSKAGNPLTNFGDISLFGTPDMAIPKGANPVYPGDAYTARAPRLVRDVPKSADRDRLYEKLTGEKGKGYRLNLDDPFWDDGFRIGYLRSVKGLTPPPGADLSRWVRDNIGYGERDAVERFVSDFLGSHKGVIRERIDKGWSNDGERRLYAPHTLENMVKASKGKAGSEDFNYGPMAWKAATMSPFRSLADIQENRGLIRTEEKAALEAQKDQLSTMGFKLAEALGYRDTHPDMIFEGLRSSNPEIRALAQELRAALKSLPTEYFEAKPQRAVDMGEFKAAAVPEGMNDAAGYLTRRGLDVRRVPNGEDARKEALTEILLSRPDLLFEGGDPAAAFAPAQEEGERPSEAEGLMSRLMRLWGDR